MSPEAKNCPKCRTVSLVEAPGRANRLLRCPSCKGTWLPKDEARAEAVADLMEADDTMKPGAEVDLRTGLCPLGHGILIRAKVELDEPFYLDRCTECQGVWFDAGEFNKLARSHLLSNLGDLWNPARRFRVDKERAETAYKEKLKGQLGPDAFLHLETLASYLKSMPPNVQMAALAYLREMLD